MCNVYSFSGFAKILLKHNIQFSIRDFLNDEKVDLLIQQVVNKTCNERSWAGAGIARSCFIEPNGLAAIKISKEIYTDITDYDAEDAWASSRWDQDEDDYDPWGYVVNNLQEATKVVVDEYQNKNEIRTYQEELAANSIRLGYIPTMYAASTNHAVQIVEKCEIPSHKELGVQSERRHYIYQNFYDTHDGNFGLNKQGLLVILDYGFE